jgi:hypothetical protein
MTGTEVEQGMERDSDESASRPGSDSETVEGSAKQRQIHELDRPQEEDETAKDPDVSFQVAANCRKIIPV